MGGELTIALAGVAGLLLVGLVGHGVWTARKAGARREAAARAEPVEPTLAAPGDAGAAGRIEPVLGADPAAEPPRAPRRNLPRLDALIDALATLSLEAPITGELAAAHLPTTRRAGSKPFFIEGHNQATHEWEPPQPGAWYREFQAGVQLVGRSGPLNEIEFSEFVQKAQAFADAVGATADFPDMLDVVARARELDGFASSHDAQLAVHLRARGPAWAVGFVQQQAAAQGFVPGLTPGRLVLPGSEEGAPPMLVLSFDAIAALSEDPAQAVVREATLAFDVPQTDAAADPFMLWQACAQSLAAALDADIVDDDGRAVPPQGFAAIGAELSRLYDALDARDMPAGSALARRLFS
jgi:hypothetical protein